MALGTWHFQNISFSSAIHWTLAVYLLLLAGQIHNANGQIEKQPWYDALPAVAMDYKIHLPAGKEDCYYQYVQPGATLYVSFQVRQSAFTRIGTVRLRAMSAWSAIGYNCSVLHPDLQWLILQVIRGGDGSAGFAVRHPNGQLVKAYEWLPSSDYSEPTSTGGYYAVCLDNQFSRFASKLVNIYMTVIKYDEWQKYAQELEGLQLNIQNFTVSIRVSGSWKARASTLFDMLSPNISQFSNISDKHWHGGTKYQRHASVPGAFSQLRGPRPRSTHRQ